MLYEVITVISHGNSFTDAIRKALRSIKETKITGVKTNIAFLVNVLNHPKFASGDFTTGFIPEHPELFDISVKRDYEGNILKFIAEIKIDNILNCGVPVQLTTPGIDGIKSYNFV